MPIKIDRKYFKCSNKINIFIEIRDFMIIFLIIAGFGWLFVNAQLVVFIVDGMFNKKTVFATGENYKFNLNKSLSSNILENGDNMSSLKKKILKEKLGKKIGKIENIEKTDIIYKPTYESYFKKNMKDYNIQFNKLPPDDRLLIPKIGTNVPVISLKNANVENIENANYDEYLNKGVVRYPYTAEPGKKGNVFIFGHTSYYWWENNPYGTVFANIAQLRHGDQMILSRGGKKHSYKIFKKVILYPYQVDEFYEKYQKGEYLTIMGCYPIGSDKKRMLVIAKKI